MARLRILFWMAAALGFAIAMNVGEAKDWLVPFLIACAVVSVLGALQELTEALREDEE